MYRSRDRDRRRSYSRKFTIKFHIFSEAFLSNLLIYVLYQVDAVQSPDPVPGH